MEAPNDNAPPLAADLLTPLMDLAARATPRGSESLGFAISARRSTARWA